MSRYDYLASQVITLNDYPFYALLMAAMRQADTKNRTRLMTAFPQVWDELEQRYNVPSGVLPGEQVPA